MKLNFAGTSCLVMVAALHSAASAQDIAAPDAGVSDAGAPDATAAVAAPAGAADGGEPGLFEQALPGAAPSSNPGASAAAPAAPAPPPFTLSGYVRGDMFIGKVPDFGTATMKAAYAELSLALRTARGAHGDGFAEARVRYGLADQQGQPAIVDLREAYANAYLGPVDLRVGRQIVVWGRADVLNPTNNLTPFDLRVRSPVEDDRRLGNVGARMFIRLAPLRLEAVWMPIYAPSELPAVGLPQFVVYGEPRYPSPELQHGLVAGRVHLELPAFEMSVSYLRGYAPLPGLALAGVTFDAQAPEVRVARTAYQQQVVGLDFSTAVRDVLAIRGEAAYRRSADYQSTPYAPRPDVQYALGVDRAFGSVTVIAQYLGRYVIDWRRETGPDQAIDPAILMGTPSAFIQQAVTMGINLELARTNQILFNQTERLQHLATARVEWLAAHDTLSLTALALVNFTTREWVVAPKIGYRLSDAMIATVGAEVFMGPDGTLFGLIDQALSAGYAELRISF